MTRTNDDEPPEWAKEQAREMMAAEEPSDDEETEKGDGGETEEGDGERDADADDDRVPDVPADTVDEAERLTRLARRTEDEAAAAFYRERRDELVTDHDYVPRLREEDDTLVLYPDEWMDDGTVQLDRIETTTDGAVEVSLDRDRRRRQIPRDRRVQRRGRRRGRRRARRGPRRHRPEFRGVHE